MIQVSLPRVSFLTVGVALRGLSLSRVIASILDSDENRHLGVQPSLDVVCFNWAQRRQKVVPWRPVVLNNH